MIALQGGLFVSLGTLLVDLPIIGPPGKPVQADVQDLAEAGEDFRMRQIPPFFIMADRGLKDANFFG